MAKRRRFTPEFKAEVVLEALRGESSQAELCRRHNLSPRPAFEVEAAGPLNTFHLCLPLRISSRVRRPSVSLNSSGPLGRLTLSMEIEKKALTLLD